MEEIDAQGRQMLVERPYLTRGRLSVFRETTCDDNWFPRINVTLKRTGSDAIFWQWTSHSLPIDFDEPPPYGEDVYFEKYFELEQPVKSPRGLEAVFTLGPGDSPRAFVDKLSASLYLYPRSLDERGIQVGVVDMVGGLTSRAVPLYFRINFPW